jgi:hypothetical protein
MEFWPFQERDLPEGWTLCIEKMTNDEERMLNPSVGIRISLVIRFSH